MASKSWTLSEGNGAKTVYVKFRNSAGTASEAKTLTVKLKGQGFEAQQEPAASGGRASGTLVKYASSGKVYMLENGKKRWIKTAEIFNSSGYDWKKIVIVPDSEKYDDGADKDSAAGSRAEGSLVKYGSSGKVYVLENGKKRWIPDAVTFVKLGYGWGKITTISDSESYPDGESKSSGEKVVKTAAKIFTKLLKRGLKDEQVKNLQQKLKDLGYLASDVEVTGYFGKLTEAALKKFQAANNIDAVGYVGPKTRERLNQ